MEVKYILSSYFVFWRRAVNSFIARRCATTSQHGPSIRSILTLYMSSDLNKSPTQLSAGVPPTAREEGEGLD